MPDKQDGREDLREMDDVPEPEDDTGGTVSQPDGPLSGRIRAFRKKLARSRTKRGSQRLKRKAKRQRRTKPVRDEADQAKEEAAKLSSEVGLTSSENGDSDSEDAGSGGGVLSTLRGAVSSGSANADVDEKKRQRNTPRVLGQLDVDGDGGVDFEAVDVNNDGRADTFKRLKSGPGNRFDADGKSEIDRSLTDPGEGVIDYGEPIVGGVEDDFGELQVGGIEEEMGLELPVEQSQGGSLFK